MPPKRKQLTIEERKVLINQYNSGLYNQRVLAVKHKVGLSTVSKTIKNADKYLNCQIKLNAKAKTITNINEKNKRLNELIVKFIQTSNATKNPIDGQIIKNFALDLAEKLELNGFKASNGWLENLNKRYSFINDDLLFEDLMKFILIK